MGAGFPVVDGSELESVFRLLVGPHLAGFRVCCLPGWALHLRSAAIPGVAVPRPGSGGRGVCHGQQAATFLKQCGDVCSPPVSPLGDFAFSQEVRGQNFIIRGHIV